MINESEILENVVKMKGKISQDTLDEMSPWVESHDKKQERRNEDLKREQKQNELYKFDNLWKWWRYIWKWLKTNRRNKRE